MTAGEHSPSELDQVRYRYLQLLAHRYLRHRLPDFELQTTELMHEAYLRLHTGREAECKTATHFCAIFARKLKHALIDHIRRRNSTKRGGTGRYGASAEPCRRDWSVELDDLAGAGSTQSSPTSPSDLAGALAELERESSKLAHTVVLRCICGLSTANAAAVLGVSDSTVKKDLAYATAWLRRRMVAD